MSSPVITLYPDQLHNLWIAHFHDDPEVLKAFGTDLIPTAYTIHTPGLTVQRDIQRRNPDARVDLRDQDGTILPGKLPTPKT